MKSLKYCLLLLPLSLLLVALGSGTREELVSGLLSVLKHPGILVTDYFAIAGIPATLCNAALVGFMGWVLLSFAPTITGSHVAAFATLIGFSFFGKNPLNVSPVLLGCFLFARFARRPFQEMLPVSLFATSLAPVVSFLFYQQGFRLEIAFLSGVLSGFLTLAIAPRMASFHSGYNLYNVGFSGGIVGTLLAALLGGFGFCVEPSFSWHEHAPPMIPLVLCIVFAFFLSLGWFIDPQILASWRRLLGFSGKPPVDFLSFSLSATLWNMGITGFLGVAYVLLVGGDFNGPVLGGILTMVGFSACGKHIRNTLPILLGVYIATLCSSFKAHEPGPLLAALFSSALAPVAGELGVLAGLLAGFLHLFVVMSVGFFHGGLNLYNNGFAAGFVAVIVVSVFSQKSQKDTLSKTFRDELTDG